MNDLHGLKINFPFKGCRKIDKSSVTAILFFRNGALFYRTKPYDAGNNLIHSNNANSICAKTILAIIAIG